MMLRTNDIASGSWTLRPLADDDLGAWEPSMDPISWRRMAQVQMLVQPVSQRDGNDSAVEMAKSSRLGTLVWSPTTDPWAGEQQASPPSKPDEAILERPVRAEAVLALMEKAADWQLKHPSRYNSRGWELGPFWVGIAKLARISLSPRFHDAALDWAETNHWEPGRRFYHADDLCVIQAYLELYQLDPSSAIVEPSLRRLQGIVNNPSNAKLDWGTPSCGDRWSWCDALFMAPPAFALMSDIAREPRLLEFMDKEWWATTRMLFMPNDGFYLRDGSFKDIREPNGERVYWGRGDGWVAAGLCRVLENMPADYPRRSRYETLYLRMMRAVMDAQQPDGLWRPGLLDPGTHTALETSGSSFYVYALTWGLNNDLLTDPRAEDTVRRGWNALVQCVTPEGKLEHVQPVGLSPVSFDPHNSEPFAVGAFLLAGSELYKLTTAEENE